MVSFAFLLLPSIVLVSGNVYHYKLLPAPTNYARNLYPFNQPRPLSQVYFSNKKPTSQASSLTRTSATSNTVGNRPSAASFRLRDPVSQLFQKVATIYNSAIVNAGDDVVSQTKAHTKGLIGILKEFATDPKAVEFVKANTAGSSCIKSLDDAISATQTASDLIEKSGPELNTLLNTYADLKDEKDIIALMKGSAQMMLTLDTLIPKLADFPLSTQCRVSPDATLKGMQELANLVNKLAQNTEYPVTVRSTLVRSGSIVGASTTFIGNLRKIFKKFPLFCSSDEDYNTNAVQSIGDIIDEVTILLNAVGSNQNLNEIRQKNIKFATQLVDTLKTLRELDLGFFDCNTVFSWKRTGEALLEVADLVNEVGVEELSEQLGINFNLQF